MKLLVTLFLATVCYGQSPAAAEHLDQLYEHWRWQAYWEPTTDLGSEYTAGARIPALLFWRKDEFGFTHTGFCAAALKLCRNYPTFGYHLDVAMNPNEDSRSVFTRSVVNSFGEYDSDLLQGKPHAPAPGPNEYTVEEVTIVLPPLDPPRAIRERVKPPSDRTDDLLARFGCSLERPDCDSHVLIPYYGEDDLYVAVYRECGAKCTDPPTVLFPMWIDDHRLWWQGATNATRDPDLVRQLRQKIEKALLVEVGRPKP